MQRLLLLFIFLPSLALAQEVRRLEGYVQMPGQEPASYFLQLTVKDTKVTGYSITDYKKGNRYRASLTGKLEPASELYIEENGVLKDKERPDMVTCYFSAHLKLSIMNNRQRWTGPFSSRQSNGVSCGEGYMTLLEEAPPPPVTELKTDAKGAPPPTPKSVPKITVRPVAKEIVKAPPKDTLKPVLQKEKPRPVIVIAAPQARPVDAPQPVADSNGCMRSYDWSSDSLSFDVWDGWTIDGDVISLSVNGHMLLDHKKLSEIKQHFVVPLTTGKTTMLLYLHDEGFEPPNTPNLVLFDGKTQYELGVSGNSGEKIRICFNRLK